MYLIIFIKVILKSHYLKVHRCITAKSLELHFCSSFFTATVVFWIPLSVQRFRRFTVGLLVSHLKMPN